MRQVVCPHCQQAVPIPDELAQAHCVRCGHPVGPANTQFTASPSALPPQSIQPIDQFERVGDEAPRVFTDWDEFRATSPALEQELLELARRPMPDLRNVYLKPLPEDLPPGTDRWKRPLGTIEGTGNGSFNLWALACSLLLAILICTAMMMPVVFRRGILAQGVAFFLFAVTMAILARALWFCFVRMRKPPYTMWVFEEGILWHMGLHRNGSVPWTDVRRFQMGINPVTRMPIYWLTVADEICFDIEIDRAPALIPLLEFMEIRLTASQLLPRLEKIYAGQRVGFGAVQLNRRGFTRGKFFAPWSQIERVMRDREQLFVHVRGRADWVTIPYASVSFPLVVMALSHILIDEEKSASRAP